MAPVGEVERTRAANRLLREMSRLTGQPLVTAARVNVAGLSTFRGAALFVGVGALAWGLLSRSDFAFVGIGCAVLLDLLAWMVLRRRGWPLRFGPPGGVIAVDQTTLFVARTGWWTGRAGTLLGSWPRADVAMSPVPNPTGQLRRFDLRLPGTAHACNLELVQNRGKDETLSALSGPDPLG